MSFSKKVLTSINWNSKIVKRVSYKTHKLYRKSVILLVKNY